MNLHEENESPHICIDIVYRRDCHGAWVVANTLFDHFKTVLHVLHIVVAMCVASCVYL